MDDTAQAELINNYSQMFQRLAMMQGATHDGKRDLYEIFGYSQTLAPNDFAFRFKRGDIAKRIVKAFPDAVWSNPPEILDDPDNQEMSNFEKECIKVFRKMKLWSYLQRADTLAALGRFSILLLGFPGSGETVKNPVQNAKQVAYLMPYGETNVKIHKWVKDVHDPRFGKPLTYMISIADASTQPDQYTPGQANGGRSVEVHYTRVMHFAEGLLDSEVYGTPILESVMNKLADLDKVVGGGAEIYWLNSRGGLNLNVDKDAKIGDPEKMTKDAEDFVNQLTRILKTKGMAVTPIQFTTESPEHQFDAIISLISGATGIPKRILLGSEEGKLASTQDEDNWFSRVHERRVNYNEPYMVRPMIDLLIEIGMLPKPLNDEYIVKWPDLITTSEKDQADIGVKIAQAISAYVNAPGSDLLLPPKQFVEEVLKKPYQEAEIAELEKEHEQEEEDALAMEQEGAETDHERQKELVREKAGATTTGGGGGGGPGQGAGKKTRVSEPGNAPPAARARN